MKERWVRIQNLFNVRSLTMMAQILSQKSLVRMFKAVRLLAVIIRAGNVFNKPPSALFQSIFTAHVHSHSVMPNLPKYVHNGLKNCMVELHGDIA
jgi:hypothetical protein